MDLLSKAVVTALLTALALVVARRFGAHVSGLFSGMPFATVAALAFVGGEQGSAPAADVAVGSIVGCGLAAVFAIAYERAARRAAPPIALAAGLLALGGAIGLACQWRSDLAVVTVVAVAACLVALATMPRHLAAAASPATGRPGAVIALAALAAGFMGAATAAGAHRLGPQVAGLLSAVPLVGVAAVVAEHTSKGSGAVSVFFRGYLVCAIGKVGFGAVFSMAVLPGGVAQALAVALIAGAGLTVVTTLTLSRGLKAPLAAPAA